MKVRILIFYCNQESRCFPLHYLTWLLLTGLCVSVQQLIFGISIKIASKRFRRLSFSVQPPTLMVFFFNKKTWNNILLLILVNILMIAVTSFVSIFVFTLVDLTTLYFDPSSNWHWFIRAVLLFRLNKSESIDPVFQKRAILNKNQLSKIIVRTIKWSTYGQLF